MIYAERARSQPSMKNPLDGCPHHYSNEELRLPVSFRELIWDENRKSGKTCMGKLGAVTLHPEKYQLLATSGGNAGFRRAISRLYFRSVASLSYRVIQDSYSFISLVHLTNASG
jgi:hypothetical protein